MHTNRAMLLSTATAWLVRAPNTGQRGNRWQTTHALPRGSVPDCSCSVQPPILTRPRWESSLVGGKLVLGWCVCVCCVCRSARCHVPTWTTLFFVRLEFAS
ncbi:hypothetical protein BKA56DRAFT_145406 [Ilyonectria sp. MPI-CAGE-AT-0026]|nr:hypothetical protein BKA56DRAFT_145406 [Ilyonectria sp. MPI-CAGE-AT-0026]